MLLKPTRGIRLNKSHPLARGLVGYWLLNEGSGNKVFDLSGNGNIGTLQADTHFVPGKFGPALDFDGTGDYVELDSHISDYSSSTEGSISIWFKSSFTGAHQTIFSASDKSDASSDLTIFLHTINNLRFTVRDGGSVSLEMYSSVDYRDGLWHLVTVTVNSSGNVFYVDENSITPTYGSGSASTQAWFNNVSNLDTLRIGIREDSGGNEYSFNGLIDNGMIFNRALSASEVALLYREPFCMFDRADNVARLSSLVAPQIIELAGTSMALSSLSALTKASRKVGGTITSTSNVDGSLGIMADGQIIELIGTVAGRSGSTAILAVLSRAGSPCHMSWLFDALFNGMTANAFKLGTSLSLGWFWVRVTGCSVLYRGTSMGNLKFQISNLKSQILAVSDGSRIENPESRIEYISPPSYIPHNNGSTYFYVVRRFNKCGYQEHTLAAAVKVSIGSSGELAEPQPNNISSSKVEQVASNKVRLTWYYCPLEQGSKPVSFNVYYDDRTGQIDYENPLATIDYKGRKFYSFQSSELGGVEAGEEADEHLFAIRTEDASGIENISLARLKIQLDTLNPEAIDILRAEAV